jgi:hypothetical protein
MSGGYKVEWTEPTYGCCYMNESDYYDFIDITGSPEQIYNNRHNILKKYPNQKPFEGDGKLFYYNWEQYKNSLPQVNKVNGAMQAEKTGRYNIIFQSVNSGFEYKNALLNSFNDLSQSFKESPSLIYEDKISISKNPLEGIKKNTGNLIKSVSIIGLPEVADISNKVTDQLKNANLKTEGIINSKIGTAVNSTLEVINNSYINLKENITSITDVVENWSSEITNIQGQLSNTIAQSIRDGSRIAEQVRQQYTGFIKQIEDAARENLEEAVKEITGAFAGLAALINQPVDAVSSRLVELANENNSGGGGGGCVVATQLNSSGLWTNRQKAELIVWCEKNLHGKILGECFRRGYQVIGSKVAVPNLRKNNLFGKYLKWSFDNGTKMVRGKKFSIISLPNTVFWISSFIIVGALVSKDKAETTYKKLYK